MTTKEELLITKYDLLFESRLSKCESSIDHINTHLSEMRGEMRSDFRWLFGLIILIGGMMAKGFGWY